MPDYGPAAADNLQLFGQMAQQSGMPSSTQAPWPQQQPPLTYHQQQVMIQLLNRLARPSLSGNRIQRTLNDSGTGYPNPPTQFMATAPLQQIPTGQQGAMPIPMDPSVGGGYMMSPQRATGQLPTDNMPPSVVGPPTNPMMYPPGTRGT